ncbi:MAG TPA: flagellin [Hyphomicrobiaceae bacterium]|jgi:flagellin|nr:flagellin [Hyphomicrobiaceae bacterium]
MSSINTNVAAMTALQTLNMTNKALTETQNRISTGFRVAEASDNAAYWSIATTMRSDNAALSTVQDALGLGSAMVDTAYTGVKAAIEVVDEIKTKLVAARQPGLDRAKIQSEISELQKQLTSIGSSAVFSGENWLSVDSSASGYNATKSIVASFSRTGGAVSIQTISIDTSTVKLFDANAATTNAAAGILDANRVLATGAIDNTATTYSVSNLSIAALTDSTADLTTLDAYIKGTDTALKEMATAASNLGAVKSRIDLQKDFVTSLMDAIDRGVGTLVDADMNEESTKLQALQVKQQLGIQALSIANSGSQSILSLFR